MTWSTVLNQLAEEQHGLITRRQARELGVSRQHLVHLGRTRGWEALSTEVLRRRGSPATLGQRQLALILDAGPGAVLSHLPAARHWGASGCPSWPLHVVRTSRTHSSPSGVIVHTVRSLPQVWVTVLDGIPVVRPELLALQLFAVCREQRAERLVDSLWAMRLLSGRSLIRFLHELGRRGRNGTAGLRRYVEVRGDRYTPPASGLEGRAIQILGGAGVHLRRQVDSGGEAWTGRVDLRAEDVPLIVEVQSERHHAALVDRDADTRRIRRLSDDGFVVVELTDTEVWAQPAVVVDRVLAGLAEAQRRSVRRGS
jgi:very-short-patch-repair endonuclease